MKNKMIFYKILFDISHKFSIILTIFILTFLQFSIFQFFCHCYYF